MDLLLHENGGDEERWQQVNSYLHGGADVNATNPSDNRNSLLHIAVQKSDARLVKWLIEHKADVTIKNNSNVTPLELANTLPKNENSQEIIALLEYAKLLRYTKRIGTTGVKGKFYESKLLSLILLRVLSDNEIEEFYLGTNVGGIGDIDDVCLKYKLKQDPTDRFIFIQAKHKDDPSKERITLADLQSKSSPFSLAKYFESFLEIKNNFNKQPTDNIMFKGSFNEADCIFVLYTPAINNIPEKHISELGSQNHQIKKILRAPLKSKDIFQITDLNITLKPIISQRIETMGVLLKSVILMDNERKFTNLMSNYLIKRYHVVLAQKVMDVSDEKTLPKQKSIEKYREGRFADDFFTTSDDQISILRNKMFEGLSEESRDKYKAPLFSFKLPCTFGNIDLHVQGSDDDKKNKRLKSLANDLVALFKTATDAYTVKIDESFYKTKLIAGLVGNFLIYDNETKLLKINENFNSVEVNAKKLHQFLTEKVKEEFGNDDLLYQYRFDVGIDNFPVLCFDGNEQDKFLANDYQKKLYFFTNQPKEDDLENVIKKEIERQYRVERRNQFLLKIQSDAIFLKFHALVQRWWMEESRPFFLTKNCNFLTNSKKDIVDSPLLTVLTFVFMKKIKKDEVIFMEETVQNLCINEFQEGTDKILNITTAESFLTIIKVAQHFKSEGEDRVAFLDLDLIVKEGYYDSVEMELEDTNFTTYVFSLKKEADTIKLCEIINHIHSVSEKKIIVVSENNVACEIQSNCNENCVSQKDDRNCLTDLQNHNDMTKNITLVFQGQETTLDRVINEISKHLIHSEILWKLINHDTVEIGKALVNPKYNEVKEYYIPRTLARGEERLIETFEDIDESVVLIVAEPGMGKSTLLNELAIKTQYLKFIRNYSSTWTVYINLPDYSSEFKRWKIESINVDKSEAIRFICKVSIYGLEMINSKGKKSDLNAFKISEHDQDITVKSFVKDKRITLELELFIHYYNQGNIIFLFDGFDEICPHYEKEVCNLLKVLTASYHTSNCNFLRPSSILQNPTNLLTQSIVPSCNCQGLNSKKQKLWVTTRSYSNIKNMLERELGRTAYTLKPFSPDDQKLYLKRYLKFNFELSELSKNELMNIDGFFDYMLDTLCNENRHIKMVSVPLYVVYIAAIEYFKDQMSNYSYDGRGANIEKNLIEKCEVLAAALESHKQLFERQYNIKQLMTISQNPLHLYITAEYFLIQIKNHEKITLAKEKNMTKWDVSAKSFSLFEYYLEIKFKKIRFEEKKHIDISNPDNEMTFQRDWNEFIERHKKIALCAIYEDDILLKSQIIKESELKTVHDIIEKIDLGEEKNGVVDRVVDKVPRFVHLVFAEYFSVEYICDVLKHILASEAEGANLDNLWDFLMNTMLYKGTGGIRTFFDRKLNDDSHLLSLLSSDQNKNNVFKALLKQGKDNSVVPEGFSDLFKVHKTFLNIAIEENLFNIQDYTFNSIKFCLNDDNFAEFSKTIANSLLLISAVGMNNDSLVNKIKTCVPDDDKFIQLFIPSFIINILPFRLSASTLGNLSFMRGIIPQLASVDFENIALTPSIRSIFSDYINFLWYLITDK